MAATPGSTTGLPAGVDPQVEDAVEQRQGATAVAYGEALAAIMAIWAALDVTDAFTDWFSGAATEVFVLLSMAQEAAAATARGYVVDVLAAQGVLAGVPVLDPLTLAGMTSEGGDLEELLVLPVAYLQWALETGRSPAQAKAYGGELLARIVAIQVADAAREAVQALLVAADNLGLDPRELDGVDPEELRAYVMRELQDERAADRVLEDVRRILDEAAARETVDEAERIAREAAPKPLPAPTSRSPIGWIRVLTPPSCGRCAVLAGKWYGWNEGFLRHPHCDCLHIPCTLAGSGPLVTDAQAYFDSLDRSDQDHLFGAGNAQVIRDGANISQVVNATGSRAGLYYADGRQYTRAGTTKRGSYRRDTAMGQRRAFRPTPLQIIKDAGTDRAEAVRLLRAFGYITD